MTQTAERKLRTGDKLAPQKRSIHLAVGDLVDGKRSVAGLDESARTLSLTFSSEEPIERWFGDEILSHDAGAADLSRLNDSAPLLFNHNMDDLIGVVESASIGSDRKGHAVVRFAKTARGDEIMGLVADGIVRNVSFMYQPSDYVLSEADDMDADGGDSVYTARKWLAYEISMVTVPADQTVGVGRSAIHPEQAVTVQIPSAPRSQAPQALAISAAASSTTERKIMTETTPNSGGAAATTLTAADVQAALTGERQRVASITALCREHKVPDARLQEMLAKDTSLADARGMVLAEIQSRSTKPVATGAAGDIDFEKGERESYSLIRAINAQVTGDWSKAGFERSISNEISKRSNREATGFFMPTSIDFAAQKDARAYDYATTGGSGASNTIATNLLTGSFIEMLRNKTRVLKMGAQLLSGLVGNVDIPRQSGQGAVYWIAEGADTTQTAATFDKVSLSPKHMGARGALTRNMLQQTTPAMEMLVRSDLLATMALGIDAAALYGTGASNQPKGIANQSGIGSVVGGTNGAAITIDHLIALETAITNLNADDGALAYLANAKTVGALKALKSTTGQYLWTAQPNGGRGATPGEINGYTVNRSNQARSNLTKGSGTGLSELYFGNWNELLIGEWGVIDVMPNPYSATAYASGGLELRVLQTIDIAVRHAASFAVMSDAIA